jgi:hypothetical protein
MPPMQKKCSGGLPLNDFLIYSQLGITIPFDEWPKTHPNFEV